VKRLLAAGILACLLAPLASAAAEGMSLGCAQVPRLIDAFLQQHVAYHELTPELRERLAETYLDRLDPSRTVLLEGDARLVRSTLADVLDRVREGSCTDVSDVQRLVLQRYQEMEKFVRAYVTREDYAIDESVELISDPKKRGFPANREEREALYRKLVHFQISNYVAAEVPLAEAVQKLVHRYELMTRRASEVTQEDLLANLLDSFAHTLDPHSQYLSAEMLEDFQIGMALSLEGIGVALSSRDGYTIVERIIPGGAADRLNVLRENDKIIAVAQETGEFVDVIDMALRDVVRMIRGERGTQVRLTVLRQGDTTERFAISIVRDKIDLSEQAAKLEYEERAVGDRKLKLAVLDLPSFYGDPDPGKRQSPADVARLLDEARAAKADGLLLDLSRNGGGRLEDAVAISGFFLREGGIVAIQESGARPKVLNDPDDGVRWAGPLVVLVSRISASASEILVGALKDYRRGVVVGDDYTFGKGTVQSVSPLPRGLGALKTTTALFFRPGGASTQHSGVASDVVLPSLFSDEFSERKQPYSLPSRSIEPFLGNRANSDASGQHWQPVTADVIQTLGERSRARVEVSAEFAKIRQDLAEAEQKEGVIRLAEILKKRDDSPHAGAGDRTAALDAADLGASIPPPESGARSDEKEEPTPHREEALAVLVDLVAGAGR
jgi:carboxyl-terminal processing protease